MKSKHQNVHLGRARAQERRYYWGAIFALPFLFAILAGIGFHAWYYGMNPEHGSAAGKLHYKRVHDATEVFETLRETICCGRVLTAEEKVQVIAPMIQNIKEGLVESNESKITTGQLAAAIGYIQAFDEKLFAKVLQRTSEIKDRMDKSGLDSDRVGWLTVVTLELLGEYATSNTKYLADAIRQGQVPNGTLAVLNHE